MAVTSAINYRLPQVEQLLQHPSLEKYIKSVSRPVVTNIIRNQLAVIRQSDAFKQKGVEGVNVIKDITQLCEQYRQQRLTRVINATGIAVHTNLGRSPLSTDLWDSVRRVNTGYSNLELELSTGKRGGRNGLLPALVTNWIGAEDCVVVNNNAASVYLVLQALASGKEVIVSRGEQVQIGGGFRIPDILLMSGCKLVEVGTTNITTSDDYINAITENTALVLMVHQSNFSIQGFTESPDIEDVARRLPEHVRLVVDQGSGLSSEQYADSETPLSRYLQLGADLVCFSGDKILGGPQAGIIAGKQSLTQILAKNPMMRAFRPGRIVLSLLEEMLVRKLNREASGEGVAQHTLNRCGTTADRAVDLMTQWQPWAKAVPLQMQVGGGSIPSETYDCYGLALSLPGKAQRHLDALRSMPTPIIGYLHGDKLMLNLATLLEEDLPLFKAQMGNYLQSLVKEKGQSEADAKAGGCDADTK
ncbi:L-seryl-tRNA(Sec) selenium transferase [Photobacterium marinum]|uniref:L-seryl-tRNA(Sec) selenium transferase n=1 Tax=Photobacterium marinum TaxID=1056511 RepID=L8J6R1_9GAMM|nr:L-seryl-tRNA(Sec) selenium transferase [Photobacterium marinum]ELR63878.1 L-seryl-tRNA(Sec) selenium transferase [Photobacterium marinum]